MIPCKYLDLVNCMLRVDNYCSALTSCNFKGTCPFYKIRKDLINNEKQERKENKDNI